MFASQVVSGEPISKERASFLFKSQLSFLLSFLTALNKCTSKSTNCNPLFRVMSASKLLVIGFYFMFLTLLRALLTTLGILGVSNEIIYILIKQRCYKILQRMPGAFIS